MPFGNSARNSASRSTPRGLPLLAVAVAVVARRRLGAASLRLRLLAARERDAVAEAPAMPCLSLRCASSGAARVNVLPHSGQVNASVAGLDVCLGAGDVFAIGAPPYRSDVIDATRAITDAGETGRPHHYFVVAALNHTPP